jgi:hypothetical protein
MKDLTKLYSRERNSTTPKVAQASGCGFKLILIKNPQAEACATKGI